MGGTTNTIDLGRLGLSSGEGATLTPAVAIDAIELGGQRYTAPGAVDSRLDVSHTTTGYALRLRFDVRLEGPCMRCLEAAGHDLSIDAREVDQPVAGRISARPISTVTSSTWGHGRVTPWCSRCRHRSRARRTAAGCARSAART
jgi:hypothetical protein